MVKLINRLEYPNFPFIVSTPLYPEWPFVALPHVPQEIVKRVALALLSITPEMPVAQAANIAGFSISADYGPVQQLARDLRAPPYETVEFRALDVWQRYRWPMISSFIAAILIVVLSAGLLVKNRRLRQTETALRELATTDELTGVANRRQFLARAEEELARLFAERLRQRVAALKVSCDPQDIGVTVSIGIASMQRADVSPAGVLERADAALCRAKVAGRNRVEI